MWALLPLLSVCWSYLRSKSSKVWFFCSCQESSPYNGRKPLLSRSKHLLWNYVCFKSQILFRILTDHYIFNFGGYQLFYCLQDFPSSENKCFFYGSNMGLCWEYSEHLFSWHTLYSGPIRLILSLVSYYLWLIGSFNGFCEKRQFRKLLEIWGSAVQTKFIIS